MEIRRVLSGVLVSALVACGAAQKAPAPAADEPQEERTDPRAELAASSLTLFVLHEFYAGDEIASLEGSGSGFVVERDGQLMVATAAHVVRGATELELFHASGFRAPIERIVAIDDDADLALLEPAELPPGMKPVPLSDATPKLAEEVVLVSSPLGLDATLSFGTISAFRPELRAFQLAAGVSPGSSGGLVANQQGEVVGIIRAKAPIQIGGENITLITPVHDLVGLFERGDPAPLLAPPNPKRMAAVHRDAVKTSGGSPFEDRAAAARFDVPPSSAPSHYCAVADDPTATVALGEGRRPTGQVIWRVGRGRSCATIGAGTPLAVWVGSDEVGQDISVTVERQK